MKAGSEIGAYRVLSQLGQGGMGTVWLAEHAKLGRKAAIKLLHPMYSAQPDVVKRFFNEARAATAISDPGIVQIFDFGQHGDTAYIAMELLDGEPLNQRLKRLGKLPIVDALRILRQVASSLAVAHAAGIVHRDLKPENVFLVRDPEVPGGERAKLLDFGIAKIADETGQHTQTSAVIGTPSYMSPEQCRGAGHVDHRSDLYAIGCLLFALVSGRPPFHSMGSGEIIAMHLREPAPPLSSRAPGVTMELDALVARCLEKDPALRFSSAAELAGELGMMLGAMSGLAPTPGPQLPRAATAAPVPAFADAAAPAPTFAAAAAPAPWAETPWPSSSPAVAPLGEMATTLSSSVHTASNPAAARPRATSSRRTVIVSAVLVLAVGGGVIAGMSGGEDAPATPAASAAPAAAKEPAGPAATAATEPPPVAPTVVEDRTAPPEPMTLLAAQMQNVLRRFVTWSAEHAGAPCPTLDELGSTETDPWGQKLVVTCTEQPGSQRIGVISTGPDGELGSRDDVGSWQLSREVTDIVHGARWMPAPVAVEPPGRAPVAPPPSSAPSPAASSATSSAGAPAKPSKPVRRKPSIASDIPSER